MSSKTLFLFGILISLFNEIFSPLLICFAEKISAAAGILRRKTAGEPFGYSPKKADALRRNAAAGI